jgi:hypothetical protein
MPDVYLHCGGNFRDNGSRREVEPVIAEALDTVVGVVVKQASELVVRAVQNYVVVVLPLLEEVVPRPSILRLTMGDAFDLGVFVCAAVQNPTVGGCRKGEKGGRSQY